jgi:hypothetical protein
MKKFRFLHMILSAAVVVSLIVVSACTKEGPPGKDGQDGEDGINGQDGTATCAVCHNFTEDLTAKVAQYNHSQHAMGVTAFEGNRTSCAPCHTSKGFREVIETGLAETAAPISNPTQPNCYTCHNIHQSYTEADWALATTDPVTFRFNAGISGMQFDGGNGNLCVNCHQSRTINPYPDINNLTGTVTFTSFRYGPHYGPQSQILSAQAGFEIGFTGPINHPHASIENTCTSCHMAEPFGALAGGHNMAMVAEEEGEFNYAGCTDCHTDAASLESNTEELMAEVEELDAQLWDLLVAEGIADPNNYGYAVPGTYSNLVAGTFLNWKFVHHDRSKGVHNPGYTKALLNNSIAALQTN